MFEMKTAKMDHASLPDDVARRKEPWELEWIGVWKQTTQVGIGTDDARKRVWGKVGSCCV